jgi:hypothetical protein
MLSDVLRNGGLERGTTQSHCYLYSHESELSKASSWNFFGKSHRPFKKQSIHMASMSEHDS